MKICYEVTIEDLVAFAIYNLGRSPTMRRGKRRIIWIPVLAILAFVGTIAFLDENPAILGAAVVPSILWVLVAQLILRPSFARGVRKLHDEGVHRSAIGPHELELTENGLVERTPFSELRTPYQDIREIISAEGHSFIYISAEAAHVIPHDAITHGDREALIEALKQRVRTEPT